MLREDHAVLEVLGRFGLDGCHSLTAPSRQATWDEAGTGRSLIGCLFNLDDVSFPGLLPPVREAFQRRCCVWYDF